MKLYIHISASIHAITIDNAQDIGYLSKYLCGRFNLAKVSISKFPQGKEIHSDIKIKTFFEDMDDVWVIKAEESKEETNSLKPVEAMQYTSLTKYSFYEYDNNWVRVEVPFEGIGKHDKNKISCVFDENKFVLTILDKNNKNYQFSVLRLQCNIQPGLSKFSVLADKVRISLRKVKDTDNWFSLFKAKTIGGDD
jgi:CS domain